MNLHAVVNGASCFVYVFQANLKDAGNYSLIVSSSIFHESSITFQIIIESNEVDTAATTTPNTECLPNVALIILVVVFVIIIILLTVAIVVMCKRNNSAGGKTQKLISVSKKSYIVL